jgi:serine/threonine protein phosphatase PrpC
VGQTLNGIVHDMSSNKNNSSSLERSPHHIDFACAELLGSRETQEDYSRFRILNAGTELLAVLADGMGGHTGGEIASKMAVDSFETTFINSNSVSVPVKLGAALQQANNNLAVAIKNSPALDGMGCTLVAMHLGNQGLHWISVGDSPLFLYRNNQLSRLNADHSMAPVIKVSLRTGKITKEEAASHPHLHALRSSVMGMDIDLIDTPPEPISLQSGDILVLASDGLLTLAEKEIVQTLRGAYGANAENLSKALVTAVEKKKKPRQDNTTIQVVIVPSSLGSSSATQQTLWLMFAILAVGLVFAYIFHSWTSEETNQPNQSEPSLAVSEPKPIPTPEIKPVPLPPSSDQPEQPAASINTLPQDDKKGKPPNAAPQAPKSIDRGKDDGTGKQLEKPEKPILPVDTPPSKAPEAVEKGAGVGPGKKLEKIEKPTLPADPTAQESDISNKNSNFNQSNKTATPDGPITYLMRGEIWNALQTIFGFSK